MEFESIEEAVKDNRDYAHEKMAGLVDHFMTWFNVPDKCACGLHWGHTGKHAPETAGISKKI